LDFLFYFIYLFFGSPGGLQFEIFLSQPPECWVYKHEPPHPAGISFSEKDLVIIFAQLDS
jgi:hypothetical protein